MTLEPEAIYRYIERNPGCSLGLIAWSLGADPRRVRSYLPVLESQGFLLSEDEQGLLYPVEVVPYYRKVSKQRGRKPRFW